MNNAFLKLLFLFLFIANCGFVFCNLFQHYPHLSSKIPYVRLGNWPTRVTKLEALSEQLNAQIYLKDEGDCGSLDQNGFSLFGGNKVRKLEFLLAEAIAKGYSSVLTYGDYASNHVAATSCYAQKLGLQAIGILFKQNPTENMRRNLLLDLFYGARIFESPLPRILTDEEVAVFLNEHHLDHRAYVIPVGGSNILGVLGTVNAIFELRSQIAQGLLPEPDFLYVSFGSMGTAAGILLGIKLAGLKTRVKAIKITRTDKFSEENLCALIAQANNYLHECDSSIPVFDWCHETIEIDKAHIGKAYSFATEESAYAHDLFKSLEHITLDQTYTDKVAAALIDDCRNKKLPDDAVILFWNSYCSYEYPDLIQKVDHDAIPEWMQEYIYNISISSNSSNCA